MPTKLINSLYEKGPLTTTSITRVVVITKDNGRVFDYSSNKEFTISVQDSGRTIKLIEVKDETD